MVSEIKFNENTYSCRDDETLLEALLRQGVDTPFSCRDGVCHVCLLRCVSGNVSEETQKNLKPELVNKGYFMPCKCRPEGNIEVGSAIQEDMTVSAVIAKKELLSENICRLLIEPYTQFDYQAGQYINLVRDDGLVRSYSLASVPVEDYYLEIHVKLIPEGKMSSWVFKELNEGDEIKFYGPLGNCIYNLDYSEDSMLFVSTGTGLAPQLGILRYALSNGHAGPVHLFHGSKDSSGIYSRDVLQQLKEQYENFHYTLAVSGDDVPDDAVKGRASSIALDDQESYKNWRIYLCGNPVMVDETTYALQNKGVSLERVLTDPFLHAQQGNEEFNNNSDGKAAPVRERRKYPDPDLEMWAALEDGVLLRKILTDFYTRVFEDPQLSPYFKGVTKDRLIDKVYNFMYQVYTGEKVYFGDRPRNAHHWMVIPDQVFDYREAIMEKVLREHELPEKYIKKWLEVENLYRGDIVKTVPWKKIMFGMEMPLDGFEETVIDASTICDSCQGEINKGDTVRYHVRMGTTYCEKCKENAA